MKRLVKYRVWLVWLGASGLLAAWLAYALLTPGQQSSFMPGKLSHAHHQIELKCAACHGEPFKGRAGIQEACLACHATELKEMDDSHPISKFTDPRNADTLAKLDARQCVTCHSEHRPEITRPIGVTLPDDFCVRCHADIDKERPSHKGMAFNTCATSGCHNFHDNRALYEDFLVRHGEGGKLKDDPRLPGRHLRDFMVSMEVIDGKPIAAAAMDGHAELRPAPAVVMEWEHTAHAQAGVNCSACHQAKDAADALAWIKKPDHTACASCHQAEVDGFLTGLHGMRLKQGLPPMQPSMAELPMKPSAGHAQLTCVSCHGAHRFDTRKAAVEACLSCHDDGHTRAYKASPHFALWHAEISGRGATGSGVSCATCHLPRVRFTTPEDEIRVLVQHNQNDTLRPNEKMVRSVCMNCHGLQFSLDALADGRLVGNNFKGAPAKQIESIRMALEAERRDQARKAAGGADGAEE
ncbi:MAG: cytochrome c3 family protein [Porticoccaceae bacterium]